MKGFFYRSFDQWWYAQLTIDGKRVQRKLVKGKDNAKTAEEQYFKLRAALLQDGIAVVPTGDVTVAEVIDRFLDHSAANHVPTTFDNYKFYITPFAEAHGRLLAHELKPLHATGWMDRRKMKKGGRRAFVTALKRAFAWADEQGLIADTPLRKLKKPKGGRRNRTLSLEEREQIMAAIRDDRFRDFVFALQETGCRPGEIAAVTADDINLEEGVWTLTQHKTASKTGEDRRVYLTPAMIELSRKLITRYPDGPIFRGWGDRPYSSNGIRCRFRRLREKLPHLQDVVAYCYRHTFATDALERGVPVTDVAELLGHKSTEMVMRHYSHLRERVDHLRKAAARAAGIS